MNQAGNTKPQPVKTLWRSGYFWLLLGCVATLVAMLGYDYLPEKRRQLVHSNTLAYIYADERNQVEWIDMEALTWRCRIKDAHAQAFCGFQVYLGGDQHHGEDFRSYSSIEVELDYEGTSSYLRYYLRNQEPGFSDPEDLQTHKFMLSQIEVDYLTKGLKIGMEEFYVAEWWLSQYQVPRELNAPNFEQVTGFGIDTPYPAELGNHQFQLHRAELVGELFPREQWYAGIIIAWLGVLGSVGSFQLIQLRRSVVRERRRLAELALHNRELRDQSDRFRELSHRDQLTGLLNRHGMVEAIEQLFSDPDYSLALLVLDIDHFKPINDRYGHDVGDRMLAQLGALLLSHTRQSDYVARWGGEEFVLLLPEADEATARTIADKLRELIAQTAFEASPESQITVSIGAGGRRSGEAYHELFRRVDKALYRAKDQGRNRVVLAQ